MFKTQSRTDVVKDKASDVASNAGDTLASVKDMALAAKDALGEKAVAAKEAAAPHVDKAKDAASTAVDKAAAVKDSAVDAAAPKVDAVRNSDAGDKAAHYAGLTKDQAHSLFADQWMPRIQEAISAASTAASTRAADAYQALPTQAQGYVEQVAPQAKKLRKKKKGKLLIFLGLAAAAGAGTLIYKGQQEKKRKAAAAATPVVTTPTPRTDDPQADALEARVDDKLGKHSTN